MKPLFLFVCACFLTIYSFGQHYYKDLVLSGELTKKRALYESSKVKAVRINSFDNRDQPIEGFTCNQAFTNNYSELKTVTKDPISGATENASFFNQKGQLTRTIDTSEGNRTIVNYSYDEAGKLALITSQSNSPGGFSNREQHQWYYDQQGRPQRMIKIKNGTDTTHIELVLDEKGNVIEEKSRVRGVLQPSVYYYYDGENRLTDVVRYNNRAKRLLPDYIFEYDEENKLRTMLTPMEGMGDYQKWYYSYDEKGLKQKDECYNKSRVLIGRMEYQYQY